MEAEQLVLLRSPARARVCTGRGTGERQAQLACVPADRSRRAPEQLGGGIDRAHGEDPSQAVVVAVRPAPGIGGESELAGSCRHRRRRALGQAAGDLRAGESVGVAVPDDRILGRAPSSPLRGAMEPELAGMEPQCVRAASEPPCERVDLGIAGPRGAEPRVLGAGVGACTWTPEPELPPTSAHLTDRPADACCERRRGQPGLGRLAQQRILEL